jgi:hypothetical protein
MPSEGLTIGDYRIPSWVEKTIFWGAFLKFQAHPKVFLLDQTGTVPSNPAGSTRRKPDLYG